MAVSPEKIELLTSLAMTFNRSRTKVGDQCIFVSPKSKASGGAMQALAAGWDEERRRPTASGRVVAGVERVGRHPRPAPRRRGSGSRWPNQGTPFMNTPLVIAMPQPMAEALGWPDQQFGWSDILSLGHEHPGLGGVRTP